MVKRSLRQPADLLVDLGNWFIAFDRFGVFLIAVLVGFLGFAVSEFKGLLALTASNSKL